MQFKNFLQTQFPFELTQGQLELCEKISGFVFIPNDRNAFVLTGYAGTGKTTFISTLVKALSAINCKTILLAPTGRAAKVLSSYSGKQAFTIHKNIYRKVSQGGSERFRLKENKNVNAIFIVDEASMISNEYSDFSGNGLLDDLFEYVYNGDNCRLIFVGDTAQLPPVGSKLSPAIDKEYVSKNLFLDTRYHELTEVVRQDAYSGILFNATKLRNQIREEAHVFPNFHLKGFKDVVRINGNELEDALNDSYSRAGAEETIVVTRSNKRANFFNSQIRSRIRFQEDEISSGDYVMVVRNNYYWLPETSLAGFIANGDIALVTKVRGIEEKFGFRFLNAKIKLIDYPDEQDLDVKLLLNTITSESPALTADEGKRLYAEINAHYLHIENKRLRYLKIKDDPYFNALQIKFGYAVTCHKAQGGQWSSVFVDQGYLTKDMINEEYLRWLYTAITRSTEKLYLINFSDDFF
jgi:exodeoxyribonuclease-5